MRSAISKKNTMGSRKGESTSGWGKSRKFCRETFCRMGKVSTKERSVG